MAEAQNDQAILDFMKLHISKLILAKFALVEIREQSLKNLARWKSQDSWCSAYDEWEILMSSKPDHMIWFAMTSTDEHSNRLRQSPPYVGLLSNDDDELVSIRIQATSKLNPEKNNQYEC